MSVKWDQRFVDLAEHVSTWSKDPSTKVGCVLVDNTNCVLGLGYNGFPRGVTDTVERWENRDYKYKLVVHAEANAILNARAPVVGATAYVSLPPCSECMKLLAQAGVKRVVYPAPSDEARARWSESWKISLSICDEVGIEVTEL